MIDIEEVRTAIAAGQMLRLCCSVILQRRLQTTRMHKPIVLKPQILGDKAWVGPSSSYSEP